MSHRSCRPDRRRLLLAAVALTSGARVRGQAQGRPHRIGYLGFTAVNTPEDERVLAAFRQRLRELGLVEGTNLTIEWRFAEGRLDRYDEFAAEFVRLGVELVIVSNGTAAQAVMKAAAACPWWPSQCLIRCAPAWSRASHTQAGR